MAEPERIKTLDEIDREYAGAAYPEEDGRGRERAREKSAANPRATGVVFYAALVVIVLAMLAIFSDDNGVPRSFAGFAVMYVLTSSMQTEIPKDSLVITREVDADTLKIGDDITFLKDASTTVTHRVVGIYEDYANSGARGFQTQGIMNGSPDKEIVPAQNLVGKVVFHNLILGIVMLFIKENVLYVGIFSAMFIGLFFCLRIVFTREKEKVVVIGGIKNEDV